MASFTHLRSILAKLISRTNEGPRTTPDPVAEEPFHHSNHPWDKGCFICEKRTLDFSTERLDAWLRPRLACEKHEVLLETGESIISFQSRRLPGEHPLEGNLLDPFLNPVFVNGIQAWALFNGYLGGGYYVSEELVPCENYFEFRVQHDRRYLNLLFYIRETQVSEDADVSTILTKLNSRNPTRINEFWESLDSLWAWWCAQQETVRQLGVLNRRIPDSPGEVLILLKERRQAAPITEVVSSKLFCETLIRLAHKRLALAPSEDL